MKPRFLLDENIPFALIGFLEGKGYGVKHIKKIGKAGIRNGEVIQLAHAESAWLVTRDQGFQHHYRTPGYPIIGIIILNMEISITSFLLEVFDKFLRNHSELMESKRLIILEVEKVSILE